MLFNHEGLYYTKNKKFLKKYGLNRPNEFWIVQKDSKKEGQTASFMWDQEFDLGELRRWAKLNVTPFYQKYRDDATIKELLGFDIPVMALFSNGPTKYFDGIKEPVRFFFEKISSKQSGMEGWSWSGSKAEAI